MRSSRPRQPARDVFRLSQPAFVAPRAGEESIVITWVGHSTLLVQMAGLNLLTDPVWSTIASPVPFLGPRRWVRPGIDLDSLPPIDVVLLSHNHYDHCDVRTIRALVQRGPTTRWFVPLGMLPLLRRHGVTDVRELDWWESVTVGAIEVACTPAQHFSARGLFDRDRTLWCSWAVMSPSARFFFGGDTALHPEFPEIRTRYGPFDVVALPIGAYEPRWFMRTVHMSPDDAVEAYHDLSAAGALPHLVPIHWGTFKLTDEPMDEPPMKLRSLWSDRRHAGERLHILAHGQTVSLPAAQSAQDVVRRT